MTYRAVVIDDQRTARRGIALALEPLDDVDIVAEFSDGESALDDLADLEPDLVFLDIRMGGIDGLEVARSLPGERMPVFIFVTAFDEHAVDAFELAAVDYVLKPFTDERLIAATRRGMEKVDSIRSRETLDTVREAIGARLEGTDGPPSLGQASLPSRSGEPRYVTVRDGDRIRFIPVDEIGWVKAERGQVRVVTSSGAHLVRASLGDMLEWLGGSRFIRVHRSHAVNVDHVREIQPWFNGDFVALMRDGETLRISRRYKNAILKRVI